MSLLARMLREEWRLHAELFGGRFAAFPLTVAVLVGGGLWLLVATGTTLGAVAAGLHALVAFFGLQVGTIGLVGRDALRDVLGDVTLLVFSARTLPVTWRRLLATFLVKDLLYYSVLFLAPVALGYAAVALANGVGPARVALLWATTSASFALGVSLSLALAGLGTRSRAALVATVAALAAGVLLAPVDPVSLTPYGLYRSPSAGSALAGLLPVALCSVAGPLLFRPADGGVARSAPDRYSTVRAALGDDAGVATRSLLEVARSSGSVWKVLFSMGVLFGVTALLVREVARVTGLDPSPGIAFGTLLGLGSFTTYSWVTQFDDAGEYLRYPVPMAAVFAGKRAAFLALTVPAGVAYLALAALWYPLLDLLVGLVVFPAVALYVFGVTAYVTGLSPNELLFDTPLFLAFGAALAVLAVPLLVAALARSAAPTLAPAAAAGVALLGGAVGAWLSGRAGPRWAARARAGER